MAFHGTAPQKLLLQSSLKNVRSGGGNIKQFAKDMNDAGFHVSRTYINAFLLANLTEQPETWSLEHLRRIYAFFEVSEKYKEFMKSDDDLRSDRPDSGFFSEGYKYFDASINRRYSTLISLVGKYAMFRPLWSSHMPDYFIRSIVTIFKSGDSFLFQENQDYEDEQLSVQVNELSTGYLFSFGSVLFSLSNEQDYKCRRFICMHDFSSALTNKAESVESFCGEIKSISSENIGPPAHKFICRRINDRIFNCAVIHGSALLKQDQKYFGKSYAKQRRKES